MFGKLSINDVKSTLLILPAMIGAVSNDNDEDNNSDAFIIHEKKLVKTGIDSNRSNKRILTYS